MASRIFLFVAIVAMAYFHVTFAQAKTAFSGGRQNLPNGGYSEDLKYQPGPIWGSLSQTHDWRGFSSPITVGVGTSLLSEQGHGGSASLTAKSGIGGQGSLRGQVGVVPNVNVFAQHQRTLDRNLRPVGAETNSLGVNYQNQNGASAFLSGSQTHGKPATGKVGGSIPIVNSGGTVLSATGQVNFGHDMKPDHKIGVRLSTTF